MRQNLACLITVSGGVVMLKVEFTPEGLMLPGPTLNCVNDIGRTRMGSDRSGIVTDGGAALVGDKISE